MALFVPDQPFTIRVAGQELRLGPVSVSSPRVRFDPDALRDQLA